MDTFVLLFPKDTYTVTNYRLFKDFFEPIDPADIHQKVVFMNRHNGIRKYIQNPPIGLREEGKVYPNLTIWERFRRKEYVCDLHVSVSLPKLLNGHSFHELYDEQRVQITNSLIQRLNDMGIKVTETDVLNAIVQTVHFSFNFLFQSEAEARMFLDRISKCSLGGWFENHDRTYANDGHAVRFHSGVFEVLFYLKYYDVLETKNKSIDRRKTPQERAIAKEALKNGSVPPLMRMEIRMNGRRSIQNHLKEALDIDKKIWTFLDLFNQERSRKILKYYWNKIIEKPENRVILSTYKDVDICRRIKERFKDEKIKTVSEALGLLYMLRSLGVKDIKSYYYLRHSRQTWYRKRKLIANFVNRYCQPNEELIYTVNKAIESSNFELNLPLV